SASRSSPPAAAATARADACRRAGPARRTRRRRRYTLFRRSGLQHADRHEAAEYGAVPELALRVLSPALDDASCRQRARIVVAGADLDDARREPRHRNGHEAARLGAVSELAVLVVAPAQDAARRRD